MVLELIDKGPRLLRGTACLLAALVVCLTGPALAEAGERGGTACGHERTIRVPAHIVPTRPCTEYGKRVPMGDGAIRSYTQRVGRRPLALGVTFPAAALRNLPVPVSDGKHCFDKDGDGEFDLHTECAVGHEHVLDLPRGFRHKVDTPFEFALTNWNPQGHMPVGVYNVPHFDFHFYIQSLEERNAIRVGPCPVLTNCDDYERAKLPVPERYRAPDFADFDAVEPAMGNHLIDPTGPEFNGRPFTHTWIYGQYDARITFYETMITKAWFDDRRDVCVPFKQPSAWQQAGWYPTSYCIAYRENRDDYTVSLTGFRYRQAS